MGCRTQFVLFSHLDLINMASVNGLFRTKMALLSSSFWVSVSSVLFTFFRFFSKILFRYIKAESSRMNNSRCSSVLSEESNREGLSEELCSEISNVMGKEEEDLDGKGTSERDFVFKFKFPSFEEFSKSHGGNSNSGSSFNPTRNREHEDVSSNKLSFLEDEQEVTSSKYDFLSGKNLSCFMEEEEASSFTVEEFYVEPIESSLSNEKEKVAHVGFLSENDFGEQISEAEAIGEKVVSDSGNDDRKEEDDRHYEKFPSETNYMGSDSDSDSICSSHEFSFLSQFVGSTSDGFISDTDFEAWSEVGSSRDINGENLEAKKDVLDNKEDDEDILEELRKIEESEKLSGKKESQTENSSAKDETPDEQKQTGGDFDESADLETLWEHQELIEQLKMELRKVRASGLPTILEESESPKITEDLKPWKIDEKFQQEDKLSELHKFYKSYRERMRKFDILNYQKMYALGFFQSKDPLHFVSNRNSSNPAITSLFPQGFWGSKRKKSLSDPMMKFMKELRSDLEMVYVGQLCLSWEVLQWQYEKAFELWESDPYTIRQYNVVAGEFQQFEVLLQRFVENEPFQGPRVENYVKNRCVMRNLLQVPVIREDPKEKRRARRGRDNDAITSDVLLEILEESIRTIWRFIKADKYTNHLVSTSRKGIEVELQDPEDSKLLMEVQTDLQKKDKRLKEVLRSGNCILKKLQKHQEDGTDHLYFFSQVDMRLVSRVLNMSRITTDQLVWCHNKLSKINFVKRKIHVEPSFLLFPC